MLFNIILCFKIVVLINYLYRGGLISMSDTNNLKFTSDEINAQKLDELISSRKSFQIVAVKKNNNLLENKQIVKTFYVAQNAQEIILMGRADLLNEYLNYFKSNGVTAKFKLQPVNYEDSNLVNMLFFNKIEEVK